MHPNRVRFTMNAIAENIVNEIVVPKILSEEQIKFFVEEGYLIVEDLINKEELDELKQDVVNFAHGKYPSKNIEEFSKGKTKSEVLKEILCIHQTHYISEISKKYVEHPKICGALSQIVGAHLPFWDGSVKCCQSMMFVKHPGLPGQAWHQDECYIPTRDRTLTGAWIAIDDADEDNGSLYVLPKSHRDGYLYPMRPNTNPEEFDFAPECYGFDDTKKVPVVVKAGAVVFFNGYLMHRSSKNRSDKSRRVLVNHYLNSYSHLPWNKQEDTSVALSDVRKIVPVSGVDPYAWKGIDENNCNDVSLRGYNKPDALEGSKKS